MTCRDDPHLKATGFFVDYDHPTEGTIRTTASPTLFSATPATLHRAPPLLGEHSESVLREIGYDESRIAHLTAAGIIAPRNPCDDMVTAAPNT